MRALAVVALAGSLGCTHATAYRMGPGVYSPTPPDSVAVYPTDGDVERPHTKIGVVYAEGIYDTAYLVQYVRKKAAELGAHAVILRGTEQTGNSWWKMEAIAIRFTDPPTQ